MWKKYMRLVQIIVYNLQAFVLGFGLINPDITKAEMYSLFGNLFLDKNWIKVVLKLWSSALRWFISQKSEGPLVLWRTLDSIFLHGSSKARDFITVCSVAAVSSETQNIFKTWRKKPFAVWPWLRTKRSRVMAEDKWKNADYAPRALCCLCFHLMLWYKQYFPARC